MKNLCSPRQHCVGSSFIHSNFHFALPPIQFPPPAPGSKRSSHFWRLPGCNIAIQDLCILVQGTGLYGKEEENFVERADLLNRPLRTRMVGGVGGDG